MLVLIVAGVAAAYLLLFWIRHEGPCMSVKNTRDPFSDMLADRHRRDRERRQPDHRYHNGPFDRADGEETGALAPMQLERGG
jgi:hypothetical protein